MTVEQRIMSQLPAYIRSARVCLICGICGGMNPACGPGDVREKTPMELAQDSARVRRRMPIAYMTDRVRRERRADR